MLGIRRTYSRLKPPASPRGLSSAKSVISHFLEHGKKRHFAFFGTRRLEYIITFFLLGTRQDATDLLYICIEGLIDQHPCPGIKDENTSSISPECRKRRLNGAVSRNNHIKRVAPCRCRTGTLKNPTKCIWRWEPDRRYNLFFNFYYIA